MDTIFALSSGQPPAGIAVIRISGPQARAALALLAGGSLPEPRRARFARLRDAGGVVLDDALILWLPGPGTATGEDVAELHCHGGRAVVRAVEVALDAVPGLRLAEPGEFTRRAFANGRIDLAEAEGLADLLSAETELQRRAALAMVGGALSRAVEDWREKILQLSAQVEAVLDFADEDDVAELPNDFLARIASLSEEIAVWLAKPHAEILKEGYRVVLAGPPNAGKSTLFNALVESEAAITSPLAGTTRDVIIRPVAIAGIPFSFVDTAGLHEGSGDVVEAIGIDRAQAEVARADLVLWLGPEGEGPVGAWEVDAQCDREVRVAKGEGCHRLSAMTGEGIEVFKRALVDHARMAMPVPGEGALNSRQRKFLGDAMEALDAAVVADPLLAAEGFRLARVSFDRLVGRATTEDMLDALFGRFCIGK